MALMMHKSAGRTSRMAKGSAGRSDALLSHMLEWDDALWLGHNRACDMKVVERVFFTLNSCVGW
jgi:hypothetical protein